MAESGGTKVMRGVSISFGIVALLILVAVFWQQIVDTVVGGALSWPGRRAAADNATAAG